MMKYSRQRAAILSFLRSRKDHPSAEFVYMHVKGDFPNISLGTVYRNLTQLADAGEIASLASWELTGSMQIPQTMSISYALPARVS